jgi:cysteine desulfurase
MEGSRTDVKTVYLDYNATTPVAAEVLEAMLPFFSRHYGNPSSNHPLGRAASEAIEDARMHVAAVLGADRDEIFFTSGGTESNNLALLGSLVDGTNRVRGHVITGQIEHPAVLEPLQWLESQGLQVTRLRSNAEGMIDPETVKMAVRSDTKLVSIMHANNETGVIQPLSEIGAILQDHDIIFHTDAAQSLGKIDVQVDQLGTHLVAIAGHKCYAPKGVGALYVRFGTPLHAILRGAQQERGLRPGTENVPGIVGLGRACQLIAKNAVHANLQTQSLRDSLAEELSAQIPSLLINGASAPRLPNTLSVSFPQVSGHELLQRAFTVLASTGSACHSGQGTRSATLENLGLDLETARGTVRLSLGWQTTADDIQQASSALVSAWESLV